MPRGPMYVLADPVYTTSSWYTRCFSGLRAEVSRLDILLLQVRSINEVPNDGSVRTCVLFGSDARWARHTVTALNARGIRSVLAGAQPDAFYGASGTTLDRRLLVEDMVRYFVANGRRRLACLGGVPWNVNDAVRVAAFHQAMRAAGLSSGESDVFSAGEGIDACAARMLERAGAYDGALCVNDQVGVRLLALAREKGVRVPEDLFVMGSGNFLVGELSVPTLTTSEVDYYLMGRKTVDVWQYIDKTPDVEAATVTIRHSIIPRGSTAFLPPPGAARDAQLPRQHGDGGDDEALRSLDRFENCLFCCDALDLRIISGIARGKSMEKIAADLFVALGTVNYRAKKLYRAMGVSSRKELEKALAHQPADPDALERMAAAR
ncbi:MAG TPA: substrate-binding domain-containing protein [Candidatus Aphodomonas merdavium]|nr:substrate-binding domain-containing protein [Candidatus Aphodomonas merdavium]